MDVAYPVLAGKIVERGIKKSAISVAAGVCTKTLQNKLCGLSPFTLQEALKIRNQFFPDMALEALFKRSDGKEGELN